MGRNKTGRTYRLTAQDVSMVRNDIAFQFYLTQILELALARFRWINLPDTVDPVFLERVLISDGFAIFFWDDVVGYAALQSMIGGELDIYRVPNIRTAYAVNGFNEQFDSTNSVIIYNNYLRQQTFFAYEMFAFQLYNMDRTIDTNVRAQKTPVLLQCSEEQRLTLKNLYEQYDGNAPFIFADKNLDIKGIKAVSTEAPYVADKIQSLKMQKLNEVLTYLGILNSNDSKRERMITDEIQTNMGSTYAARQSGLEMRQIAAEKINKMYGLNVQVEWRQEIDYYARDFVENNIETEVVDNE